MPRFFCAYPLHAGQSIDLPADTTRHVQVLRLQPGDSLTLFDGRGGEYQAHIEAMGRHSVQAHIDTHKAIERESAVRSHVVVGMPANDRMDWLVEKATELGVSHITPLMTAHGVLRFTPERAIKRQQHWQGIAQSACAQSGRNTVPTIDAPQTWSAWLAALSPEDRAERWVLSLKTAATSSPRLNSPPPTAVLLLSGPEGGLSTEEEDQAVSHGFMPINLGTRILRAETAPLAVLSHWL